MGLLKKIKEYFSPEPEMPLSAEEKEEITRHYDEFLSRSNSWVIPKLEEILTDGRKRGTIDDVGGNFTVEDLGPPCYESSRLTLIKDYLIDHGWAFDLYTEKVPPWAFFADYRYHFTIEPLSKHKKAD